jgi:hypothetical protein
MDILYLSTCFIGIQNELADDVDWKDFLVALSEDDLFLYLTLLIPIFKMSGVFDTLDDFWYENTRRKKEQSEGSIPVSSVSRKRVSWIQLTAASLLSVCMIVGGSYLIIWTESHLEEASTVCDSTVSEDSQADPMQPWRFGSCIKGKTYPFVPIKDYTLSAGKKLYCDCKYAIVSQYINIEQGVAFVNNMRSLSWVYWIGQISNIINSTLITNPNLKLIIIYFQYPKSW